MRNLHWTQLAICLALMLMPASSAMAGGLPDCTRTADASLPLGCANVLNLRSMVDDPKDMQAGRTLGPANGQRESTAVTNYEQNKIKLFDESKGPTTSITLSGSAGGTQ